MTSYETRPNAGSRDWHGKDWRDTEVLAWSSQLQEWIKACAGNVARYWATGNDVTKPFVFTRWQAIDIQDQG